MLDFIGSNAQYLVSLMKMTSSDVDTSEQGQKGRLTCGDDSGIPLPYHPQQPRGRDAVHRTLQASVLLTGGSGCIQGTTPGSEGVCRSLVHVNIKASP